MVEDILDSGNTLSYLLQLLEQRSPASIRLCTLLDKPERRTKPVEVHYTGFTIPDAFVVGYGLDYAEQYRNLPYIGILKPGGRLRLRDFRRRAAAGSPRPFPSAGKDVVFLKRIFSGTWPSCYLLLILCPSSPSMPR